MLAPIGRDTRTATYQALSLEAITHPSRRRAMDVECHGQVSNGDWDWPCQHDEGPKLRQGDVIHTSERARRYADQCVGGDQQCLGGSLQTTINLVHTKISVVIQLM